MRTTLVGSSSAGGSRRAAGTGGLPVSVPEAGEYVARGAARQAAWALAGTAEPPAWPLPTEASLAAVPPDPVVRERYAALRDGLASSATTPIEQGESP